MPYRQYRRGRVGIVSKSGALSYESVGATSAAGLGQSLVIAVGGDSMPGTTIADSLEVLLTDPETDGIIVIGEIGGEQELHAAEMLARHRRSTPNPKPVIAMVAGQTASMGKIMGHAGAVLSPRDATAAEKAAALERAGAVIVPHPGVMGVTMKELLGVKERRGRHALRLRPCWLCRLCDDACVYMFSCPTRRQDSVLKMSTLETWVDADRHGTMDGTARQLNYYRDHFEPRQR